jgi:hypothetical protein
MAVMFVWTSAVGASDQEAIEAGYPALLTECFDAAPEEHRSAREACIGVVHDACEVRPSVTGGKHVVGCLVFAAGARDGRLPRVWQTKRGEDSARLPEIADFVDPEGNALKPERSNDAQSDHAGAKWPNGTTGEIGRALCRRDLSAPRAVISWQERQPLPWRDHRGWE